VQSPRAVHCAAGASPPHPSSSRTESSAGNAPCWCLHIDHIFLEGILPAMACPSPTQWPQPAHFRGWLSYSSCMPCPHCLLSFFLADGWTARMASPVRHTVQCKPIPYRQPLPCFIALTEGKTNLALCRCACVRPTKRHHRSWHAPLTIYPFFSGEHAASWHVL
jgi:hypothetical protein